MGVHVGDGPVPVDRHDGVAGVFEHLLKLPQGRIAFPESDHRFSGVLEGVVYADDATCVVDGQQRVGPVEVLQYAVAFEGDHDVFPDGSLAELEAGLDVRPDQVPRLLEDLTIAAAQSVRMVDADGRDRGIVVEKDEVFAPGERRGQGRAEHEIDVGDQDLRPALDRS